MNLIAQASERVMLADTVARYKWAKKESITDPVREKALLASVARQAPNYGVPPQLAQTFFRDQIEANKVVQQGLIDGWRVAPPPPGPVPDLASSTRPQYDRLTVTLLTGLARVEGVRRADDCSTRLSRSLRAWKDLRTVDTLHAQALNRAFAHLCAGGVGAVG
jgi:chorismate mutase